MSKKMSLANAIVGKKKAPVRVIVYGLDGVGKSTFAAGAPKPIFLGTEDGTAHLDVVRFPAPATLADVHEALTVLREEKHDFSTLVIDSLDWLEPIVWQSVCAAAGKATIEDFDYGKGYIKALSEWDRIRYELDLLRERNGMNIVCIAHAKIKPRRNPEGEDFDRYVLKLHEGAAGKLREWADAVLFAQYETHVVEDEKTKRAKGVSTGRRILQTTERAAFDAKNRFAMPQTISLSWASFVDAMADVNPKEVHARCVELAARVTDEAKRGKAQAYLASCANDIHKLNELENRLKEMVK